MFSKFDGSGRVPRAVQKQALDWLAAGWDKRFHAISAPTGSGKSGIARAIQLATRAGVITPSNMLVNQYIDTYPNVNYLKGKVHYACQEDGLSCQDVMTINKEPCPGCPYASARGKACDGAPTFFNPMSYFYTFGLGNKRAVPPETLVVDEAHQLIDMILMIAGGSLRKSMYGFDDRCKNELYLIEWLREQIRKLLKLRESYATIDSPSGRKKVKEIQDEYEKLNYMLEGLREDPQNFAVWIASGTYRGNADEYLHIKPVRPPKFLIRRMLNSSRVILMSGTLLPMDIQELFDGEYRYLDLPSPIPPTRRLIYSAPTAFPMNYKTDPALIAKAIEDVIEKNSGVNTMIHTTYSMSLKLQKHFKFPVLVNTPENKLEKLEEFKKKGGIFLASGCAEGVDLKGDLCRLNIIPKLGYPDLNDPVVQKRKALTDGQQWYDLSTLKTLIQQSGRSTRSEDDFSKTYVLDPALPQKVSRYHSKLPKYFTEALVWRRE